VRSDLEIPELVGADPQRCANRWIELAHRAAPERLDPVVERAHALDGPVGDLLRQRAVAAVEPFGRARENAVGVRVLLEDPADDLVRRPPCRRYRRPLSHSA
jgi:hypothetical protein